jgi:hypothetical protein
MTHAKSKKKKKLIMIIFPPNGNIAVKLSLPGISGRFLQPNIT